MSNEVHFYDPTDFGKGVVKKCVVKGLSQFRIAPGSDGSLSHVPYTRCLARVFCLSFCLFLFFVCFLILFFVRANSSSRKWRDATVSLYPYDGRCGVVCYSRCTSPFAKATSLHLWKHLYAHHSPITVKSLSGPCTLAVFVPSIKGAPASVRLYSERDFSRPLCNKSFFKAEKITMFWNQQVRCRVCCCNKNVFEPLVNK